MKKVEKKKLVHSGGGTSDSFAFITHGQGVAKIPPSRTCCLPKKSLTVCLVYVSLVLNCAV